MTPAVDLLVLGDAKPDLIVTGGRRASIGEGERLVEGVSLTLGGSGAIAACGAAALGLDVAFCGAVGADAFGRFVIEALEAAGVDATGVRVDERTPTGASVVLRGDDAETVLTSVGSVATFGPEHIRTDVLESARHVHVASFFMQDALRPMLPGLFARARAAGASTSIDPNRDHAGDWDRGLFDVLALTDVVFANSAEIREITGIDDVDIAAEAIAERGVVAAVKFLRGGGLATWGDEMVRSEALPTSVEETTGAGASFAAGFIAGRLHGWSLDRCLALAVACAALSCRGVGGTTCQPTMEEALAALEGTA